MENSTISFTDWIPENLFYGLWRSLHAGGGFHKPILPGYAALLDQNYNEIMGYFKNEVPLNAGLSNWHPVGHM